jgi:solute carrier family 25 oxoglutarate transporter 11
MSASTSAAAPSKPQGSPAGPVPFVVGAAINCVAGMVAWLWCHPFEIIKNSIVTNYEPPASAAARVPPVDKMRFSWSKTAVMAQKLFYEGGMQRLYRGFETGQIRQIVYTPARLSLYDPVMYVITRGNSREPSGVDRMIAGGTAGALAGFVSSPIEVPLVRLSKPGAPNVSFLGMMGIVYRDSGIPGFYRGVGPLMQRTFVVGVAQVGFYKQTHAVISGMNDRRQLPMTPWTGQTIVMVTSIITGLFYSLATLPLEQARVRMSAQAGKSGGAALKYRNSVQTVSLIIKEEGFRSMFSFFTPYAVRCTSHTIISFNIIHLLQGQYKKFFARGGEAKN